MTALGSSSAELHALPEHAGAEPRRLETYPPAFRGRVHRLANRIGFGINRCLDRVPGSHWLHRRGLRELRMPELNWRLPRAGAALDGLRIAFVSDLHLGSYFAGRDVVEVFRKLAAQEPDLVCFGGDLINTGADELEHLDTPLRLLSPRLGMFAVPGNHDRRWHRDIGAWQDFLEQRGVAVLNNHGVRIEREGASLWLCGIDDAVDGRPDLARALQGRRQGEPALLLAHQPDEFIQAQRHDVDLTLSGHTHGGQMKLFGWAPISHSRHGYISGSFHCERGLCRLHVSHGVGATMLPLRWGAPPEIPIVRVVVA